MLGKLLKYEIPALGRKLLPLYVAWAATAVLLGITVGPVASKSVFMVTISSMLYGGVATAVFVMACVMIIQRYNNSLLGDEGYFSHVLPVKVSTHIANKTISALIWIVLSFVALMITGLVILAFSGNLPGIFDPRWAEFFKYIFENLSASYVLMLLELIVLIVFGIMKSVLAIYAAITIGHQARQHVILSSIAAYIGVMVFEVIVGNILGNLVPDNLYYMEGTGEVMLAMFIGIVVCVILGGLYFCICERLMKKRLNLA